MISRSHKFIFVHIQKTAGNSIRLAIEPYCIEGLMFNEKQEEYNAELGAFHRFNIKNSPLKLGKHARLQMMYDAWDANTLGPWESYLKFTCVRNPWERLISFYFSPHLEREAFDEEEFIAFAKSAVDKSQMGFVTLDGQLAVDRIVRYETLKSDFAVLCDELGIEADLPHVNQSKRKPYQEYYTAKSRAVVEALYRDDIDRFGYSFEG